MIEPDPQPEQAAAPTTAPAEAPAPPAEEESLYTRTQRLQREAEQQSEDHPENWFPEVPGESIAGEFVRYAVARKRNGDQAQVAHIRTPEGVERSLWLTHAVLRDRLQDLTVGEAIFVQYTGRRRSESSGREYAAYTVTREKPPKPDVPF